MNNFFAGMQPSVYLSFGSFLVGGAVIVWLALSRRDERKKAAWRLNDQEFLTRRWNEVAVSREKENFALRDALAEKDRVIESVLKESNRDKERFEIVTHALNRDRDVLRGILERISHYAYPIINDPAKLSAWLERLKGKKAGRKPKPQPDNPSQKLNIWTQSVKGKQYLSIPVKPQ